MFKSFVVNSWLDLDLFAYKLPPACLKALQSCWTIEDISGILGQRDTSTVV